MDQQNQNQTPVVQETVVKEVPQEPSNPLMQQYEIRTQEGSSVPIVQTFYAQNQDASLQPQSVAQQPQQQSHYQPVQQMQQQVFQQQLPLATKPVDLPRSQEAAASNPEQQISHQAQNLPAAQPVQEVKRQQPISTLTLPAFKARKEENNYISIDADTYQAAILNIKLPQGFKLECDYIILKQIEKKKQIEKLNRKLEQKAEKARLIIEEKEQKRLAAKAQFMAEASRKREQRLAESKARVDVEKAAFNQLKQNQDEKQMPLHTLAQDMSGHEITPYAVDMQKQPSRTSTRTRQNVDYNHLASGVGDAADGMDYNDIGGAVNLNQKSGTKLKAAKINIDVIKRCGDFFKKFKESSYWTQLQAISGTVQNPVDFKKTLETIDNIEKGCLNQKYQTTTTFQVDIVRMFLKISQGLGANNDMRLKVDEFQVYSDKLMENLDLIEKVIFIPQPIVVAPLGKPLEQGMKKDQSFKEMEKIKKDLEKFKKNNAALQNKLAKAQPVYQGAPTSSLIQAPGKGLATGVTPQQQWPAKVASIAPTSKLTPAQLMDVKMTPDEIAFLRNSIGALNADQKTGVIKIVQEWSRQSEGSCQFVLDQLPIRTSRELESYVKRCLKDNEKKQKRKEADAKRRERQKMIKQSQPNEIIRSAPMSEPEKQTLVQTVQTQPNVQAMPQQNQAAWQQTIARQMQQPVQVQQPINMPQQQMQQIDVSNMQSQMKAVPQQYPQAQPMQVQPDYNKMQQQNFAQMQQPGRIPIQGQPGQQQFQPQQMPQQFQQQQPLLYESLEVEKLAQILVQNPNIAISQAKRIEVDNYNNKLMQQYQQQQMQQQQFQAQQYMMQQNPMMQQMMPNFNQMQQMMPNMQQQPQQIKQQMPFQQNQPGFNQTQGQQPAFNPAKANLRADQSVSSSSSDSEDDYDPNPANARANQGKLQGKQEINTMWRSMQK